MQRAFWIQYTSLKVIMDMSYFFFCPREVWCSMKANTALFSQPAAAPPRWLASSLLAFSLRNNPCEHLNMALCMSVPPSVSHTTSFPCDFLFYLCHLSTIISSLHLRRLKWQKMSSFLFLFFFSFFKVKVEAGVKLLKG